MPTAAELNIKINSVLDEQGFDRAEERTDGLGKRLGTVLGTAGGFLLAQGVQMVAQNIGGLVSAGLDFEAQMANVNSIAQLSGTELQNLSDQVLQLTQNPGITDGPAALAAGLYQIASSGFTGADGLQILEASSLAASAGLTTTETAATAITAALNAYGLEASSAGDISDMMFQTVNDGVISFEQLASNMGNVLPMAASLGVGFEEVGAAYAQMTLQGVGASAAETKIAGLMKAALNPTQALTDAVGAHGYATAQAAIEAEGMGGFLKILTDEADGSGQALFDMLGTEEAVSAAMLLGGENMAAYIEEIERMGGATEGAGATQKALAKQMQSASFQIAKAKQQVQVAATMFMGMLAPGIAAAASALTGFISKGVIPFVDVIGKALRGGFDFRDAIESLPQPLQRTAGAIGTVAEGVGDLFRAFQDRGFSGLLDTLTIGGEGRQIISGLTALAEEAWGAFVTTITTLASGVIQLAPVVIEGAIQLGGALLDAAGDIYGWVKRKLFGGNSGPIDPGGTGGPEQLGDMGAITLGDVIVEAGLRLGGMIADVAGDLWGWVKGKLYGTRHTIGDGTGGPESDFMPNGGETITLGTILVDGAVALGTGLAAIAGNLSGWIQNKILGGTGFVGGSHGGGGGGEATAAGGGITVTIAQIAIDVLDAVASITAEDIRAWIQDQIDSLTTIKAELDEWSIIISGAPDISFGSQGGGEGGGEGGGAPLQPVIDWLEETLGDYQFYQAIKLALNYEINKEASDDLQEIVQGFLDGYGEVTAEIRDLIFDIPGVPDITLGFGTRELIDAIVDKLPSPIRVPIEIGLDVILGGDDDGGDGGAPKLSPSVKTAIDQMFRQSFIDAEAAAAYFNQVSGSMNTGPSEDQWLQDVLNRPASGGGGAGHGGGFDLLARQLPGRSVQIPPMVIPAPDTSAFDRVINEIPQRVARALAGVVPIASAGGTLIGSSLNTTLSAGLITAIQTFNIFRDTVAVVLSTAAINAATAGVAIGQGLATGVQSGVLAAIQSLNIFAAYVPAALAGAAGAAYSAGVAIGQGLANGISSQVGAVAAAARQLAFAAESGTALQLDIRSPSKVFQHMGEQVGDGFVIGIQSRYGAAGRAGTGLAGASIPDGAASLRGRGSGSGNTIVVITPDSENFSEIARKARRGGDFAELLPQLLRQGAY
jgi:TP901 family phage tail tape measure protein